MNCELSIHRTHLVETESTNLYARSAISNAHATLITTDYQTAGRGQRGNTWESEAEKNLLFTLSLRTEDIAANQQFVLCELISVALCDVLGEYTENIRIKWPNDIYYKDKKLCGILIEHDLEGMHLSRSLIGVGINVNQSLFVSDAPNPISLRQILGHEVDREILLGEVVNHFMELYTQFTSSMLSRATLHEHYTTLLYLRDTPATYRDAAGPFTAILRDVAPDGHLLLENQQGDLHSYLFKEVAFMI